MYQGVGESTSHPIDTRIALAYTKSEGWLMSFKMITKPLENGVLIAELYGEADIASSPTLKESLLSWLKQGYRHLVVNLNGVNFIDSSALGALIEVLKKTRENQGDLNLVCESTYLKSIFNVTGLAKLFKIFGDGKKAINVLAAPGCLDCALFCGLPNCPVIKSLCYAAEPCNPKNRLSWLSSSLQGQSGELAQKRRKILQAFNV